MPELRRFFFLALLLPHLLAVRTCDPNAETALGTITQNDCPVNARCLPTGYCGCELGFVGGCSQKAHRMQDGVQIRLNVSQDEYTFFEVLGDTESYTLLTFNLCHFDPTTNTELIDVWDDNGTLDVLTKENAELGGKTWPINQGCLSLNTPFMMFGLKQNGEPQGFILGMRLGSAGSVQVSLTVSVQLLDFWGLMLKVLIILGACFLLTLSMAVAYVVYKYRRRQLFFGREVVLRDTEHLETFMPRFRLQRQSVHELVDELCSVCLVELGEDSWVRRTVCGHVFHQDCLDEWCKANLTCPMCRMSFELDHLKDRPSDIEVTNDSSALRESIL